MTINDPNPSHLFSDNAFKRESVPNTDALKRAIIESAKDLPQQVPSYVARAGDTLPLLRFRFRSMFLPAVVASLAFIAVAGVFSFNLDQGDSPNKTPMVAGEGDFDWQELVLIEDELLFASL